MAARTKLFTIGYEGRILADFVRLLRYHGVDLVVDVRELPLSRRRGFSKTPLGNALSAAGIDYLHLRDAGNPFRREAARNINHCLGLYREHLDANPGILDAVAEAITGRRAALLCMEAEAALCHRSVIAKGLARRGLPPALDL